MFQVACSNIQCILPSVFGCFYATKGTPQKKKFQNGVPLHNANIATMHPQINGGFKEKSADLLAKFGGWHRRNWWFYEIFSAHLA